MRVLVKIRAVHLVKLSIPDSSVRATRVNVKLAHCPVIFLFHP